METIENILKDKINSNEITATKIIGIVSRIRYNNDPTYKENRDKLNHDWYIKKNKETDNKYKAELCQRIKDKYANNEEHRENIKRKRRERYAKIKEEKKRQLELVNSS